MFKATQKLQRIWLLPFAVSQLPQVSQVQIDRAELELEQDREDQIAIMAEIEKRVDSLHVMLTDVRTHSGLQEKATETNRELREQTLMVETTSQKMDHLQVHCEHKCADNCLGGRGQDP